MKWSPRRTDAEKRVAAKLRRASGFYRFLWEIREELFDAEFQAELERSYEPRGQEPCPPALLAMVNLLQRYDGLSDADAVEAAENDRRWRLVLGCLDADEAPFGQGTLVRFRMRAVANDLDKKLVDRTVELVQAQTELHDVKEPLHRSTSQRRDAHPAAAAKGDADWSRRAAQTRHDRAQARPRRVHSRRYRPICWGAQKRARPQPHCSNSQPTRGGETTCCLAVRLSSANATSRRSQDVNARPAVGARERMAS